MDLEHLVREPAGVKKERPVLLLHGAWHGAWCYDRWLDEFAACGYETHAMSLPGHGDSGLNKSIHRYSLQDYVNALAEIVGQISPTPFVIGHSLGGFVLQQYLQAHDLPGAVLLASLPHRGILWVYLRMAWLVFNHDPDAFFRGLVTGQNRRWLRDPEVVSRLFFTTGAIYAPQVIAARMCNESMLVGIRLLFGLWGRPRKVLTPLLVVAAERDTIVQEAEQWAMAAAYGAEFRLIKRQGHDLMLERDWRQTVGIITSWLEGIKPWLV